MRKAEQKPRGLNHVKNKSGVEDSLSPAGGKSKSCVKLPVWVTMTLWAASCHPTAEYGILSSPRCSAGLLYFVSLRDSLCATENAGKGVCKPGQPFSHRILGFCRTTVTFKKPLIQKMNTVENCSLDFISQMHTCCGWQMVCCRAMRWVFEDYRVFCWCDECRCFVLSCPCQPSVSSFASCLLLFSSKARVFIMTVNTAGAKRETKGKIESSKVCFSHRSHGCGGAAC